MNKGSTRSKQSLGISICALLFRHQVMGCINENVADEIRRSGDILKKRMVLC